MNNMPTSRVEKLVSCIMYACLAMDVKLETIKNSSSDYYCRLFQTADIPIVQEQENP